MPLNPEAWEVEAGAAHTSNRFDASVVWRRYDPNGKHTDKRAAFLSGFAEGIAATSGSAKTEANIRSPSKPNDQTGTFRVYRRRGIDWELVGSARRADDAAEMAQGWMATSDEVRVDRVVWHDWPGSGAEWPAE